MNLSGFLRTGKNGIPVLPEILSLWNGGVALTVCLRRG